MRAIMANAAPYYRAVADSSTENNFENLPLFEAIPAAWHLIGSGPEDRRRCG
jgi:hypothetical protein